MMKHKYTFVAIAAFTGSSAFLALPSSAATVNYFWNNTSTDMNSASSYSRVDTGEVATSLPDSDDLVWFDGLPEKQPHLTSNLTIGGIRFASTSNVSSNNIYASQNDGMGGFNHSGWVITGEPGMLLSLTRSARLDQSENNQALLNHCSYGTNRIECALSLPDAGVKLSVDRGKLFLDGPVTLPGNNGHLRVMNCQGENAALVLATANPDLCGQVALNNCNIAFAHPDAIGNIWRLTVSSENGSGTPRYIWNMTGGEFTNTTPFQIWMGKCEATVFAGPPMRFPNATLCPDSGSNHAIWVHESLTVGSVSNKSSATSGMLSALAFYGAGTLHVLGDFGPQTIPGVTNVLRILGGTVVLHDTQVMEATPVAFGINSANTRRPRFGIFTDHVVKTGLVPGGSVYLSQDCDYGGWAAYGGDHDVTLEAEVDGILRLRGWKGNEKGLSADLNWSGRTDWWKVPRRIFFGAEDSDGTITLKNNIIDVNLADSNGHFEIGAFQGKAYVAGRIAGSVTNGMDGFLGRQIRKYVGDGAVAFDGPVYLSGAHNVSIGGLLFNNATTEGTITVQTGGWLGGTGTVHAISVQTGGALRPGELGGMLTSDGSRPNVYHSNGVTFADGSSFIVDIGEVDSETDVHGCLALTGSGYPCKATGTITVVPSLVAELTGGRTVKILDWSSVSNPTDSSLFDLANWTVDADTNVFSRARLSIDGTAMYLYVRPKLKPGFLLIVR